MWDDPVKTKFSAKLSREILGMLFVFRLFPFCRYCFLFFVYILFLLSWVIFERSRHSRYSKTVSFSKNIIESTYQHSVAY